MSKDILNSGHVQDLLGGTGSDNTSSSWSRNKSDSDGTALSSNFAWNSVDFSDLVTPISSSDWDNVQLGLNDSSSDGSGNFFSALNSQTNVSVVISNNNEGLESGSLTGLGLLLDWHDLHDFIGDFSSQKEINDLIFLDGESEEVDFF